MVTNVSSQLTCQVFLETMKTCLSSSVQYQSENGGNISRARMQKPYLASFRRFCALCFNMIHRHTWIYKAHILTKSTEQASLQLQSTASNYLSKCCIYNSSGGPAQFAGPHTITYIIRRTDLLIQASRLPKWNLLGRMRHKYFSILPLLRFC